MEIGKCYGVRRAVTAADVTATAITIPTPGVQIRGAIATLRTAAGAVKAWDGNLVIANESVTLGNEGATDFADTDVFDVVIF